jgi:CheY-like chemotaxis protein
MLAAKLTQAEHHERERLAQVLHDHLQQLLVGAKINLGVLRGRLGDCEHRQTLLQIDELLDQSLTASRSLTAELSPPILQETKLSRILQWLGRWAKETYGLTTQEELDERADLPVLEVRILLFQAVRELLLNIVKHAGTNQASIRMERLETDRVQIMVSDEGVGFDPAQGRSQQAQSQTGTGLGLFSIRERLELLGGHMEIASRPGWGTQVTLVAPCRRAGRPAVAAAWPEEEAETMAQTAASAGVRRDEKVIRVLLADDHAVVRNGLTQLLQMHEGIAVVGHASDGQEAVEMALRLQPDVVLMDVTMPQINGADATRMILQQLPQTKIIGLSMHAREDVADQMTAAGAVGYLTKTAPPETLIAAIRECAAQEPRRHAEQSPE